MAYKQSAQFIFPEITTRVVAPDGATSVTLDIKSRTFSPGKFTPILRGFPSGTTVSQILIGNTNVIEGTGKSAEAFSDDRRNPRQFPAPDNNVGHKWVLLFPAPLAGDTPIDLEYEPVKEAEQNVGGVKLRSTQPSPSEIAKAARKRARTARKRSLPMPARFRRRKPRRRRMRGLGLAWDA